MSAKFTSTIALSISTLIAGCGAAGGDIETASEVEVINDTWMDDEGESLSEQSVDEVSHAVEDDVVNPSTPSANSPFGSVQQALSSTESCDTVGANRSVTGGFVSAFTTSTSYGTSGCSNAYRVNINNYDDLTGSRFGNTISHGDSEPSSESSCEKMRVGTYVWRRNANGSTTYLGNRWRWGEWEETLFCDNNGNCNETGTCRVPSVNLDSTFNMADGSNYRVASSARRYNQPRDSSSGYTRRPIRHSNPTRPRPAR